jgi:hypothetical protein
MDDFSTLVPPSERRGNKQLLSPALSVLPPIAPYCLIALFKQKCNVQPTLNMTVKAKYIGFLVDLQMCI